MALKFILKEFVSKLKLPAAILYHEWMVHESIAASLDNTVKSYSPGMVHESIAASLPAVSIVPAPSIGPTDD